MSWRRGLAFRVSPMSYSPQTGYFLCAGGSLARRPPTVELQPWFFTVGSAGVSPGISPSQSTRPSFLSPQLTAEPTRLSGKRKCPSVRWGELERSTTAGGLMFRGGDDGNFSAFDAKSGALLWQFQIGSPATPASTYELEGEQYVAMSAGSSVWAFKLGGTVQPTKAVQKPAASSEGELIVDTNQIETASLVRDARNERAAVCYRRT